MDKFKNSLSKSPPPAVIGVGAAIGIVLSMLLDVGALGSGLVAGGVVLLVAVLWNFMSEPEE
jgi:hypothetical protein